MAEKQTLTRKKVTRKDPSPEEERGLTPLKAQAPETPGLAMFQDPLGLELLQDQIGNLGVQQVLAGGGGLGAGAGPERLAHVQRQLQEERPEAESEQQEEPAAEAAVEDTDEAPQAAPAQDEEAAKEPVEIGEIKIEKPEIDYYDINAGSLEEAKTGIKDPEEWFEYEYDHETTVEEERVVQANITINLKVHLPRWAGPGWDNASPVEQAKWQEILELFQVADEEFEEMSELPKNILLGPAWEGAPDSLKTNWRAGLESLHKEEQGLLELAYRRALVLQQRLLNQPDGEITAVFDQFLKDMEQEEEEYNRRREAGEALDISLGASKLVQ